MRAVNWVGIVGFEGYFVSACGLILGKYGRVLKPQKINSGYLVVHLRAGGKRMVKTVHRLVASAFLENPREGEVVNHKNGNKGDNKATNLEWCSYGENSMHAYKTGLAKPFRYGVVGVSLCGTKTVFFKSQKAAEMALSGTGRKSSAVHHCLIGKKKSAYGYVWCRG